MTPEQQLAKDVIALLDQQKEYFATRLHPEATQLLAACKQAERAMRKRCEAIVTPPPDDLFTDAKVGDPSEET